MESPREVAIRLLRDGLTDPTVLQGERGLRHFAPHGLTAANQGEVIDVVKQHLGR